MQLNTVCNIDVQRFIDERRYVYRETCTQSKKQSILESINIACANIGISFQKLFKPKTKINAVLDEIVFLLSGTGICKVESKTLAKKTECTERTVFEAVKRLKETNEILITGLADGNNKYVFVCKSHPNFQLILKQVFFIDSFSEQPSEHSSERQNAESVEGQGFEGDIPSSNNDNNINLIQERDIIQDSIENEFSLDREMGYINTYYVNEFQYILFNEIKNNAIFHQSIKDCAAIIGLRLGSNATQKSLLRAVKSVIKIDKFIKDGGSIRESIPALFTGVFQHGLKLDDYAKQSPKKQSVAEDKRVIVPFYNWLES